MSDNLQVVTLPTLPASTYPGHHAGQGHNFNVTLTTEKGPSSHSSRETLKESVENAPASKLWEGYEDDELPHKTNNRAIRNLRHKIFSIYRRIFGVIFVVNLSIFIATAVKGADASDLGLIVVANLFCAILMRQEYVVNSFFVVFGNIPRSLPLWIRRLSARVFHIGGIHSGCAVSGTVWLILFLYRATWELLNDGPTTLPTVVVSYVIIALLLVMVVTAYPRFRHLYHNHFEAFHRFFGWTATALVWCQVLLLVNDYRPAEQSLGQAALHAVPFWMILIITVSIILPWIRLRKVEVRSTVLSDHAVLLQLSYVTPGPGSFTRMSLSPLTEWHTFATIAGPPEAREPRGYSAIVSRAGDWTSALIANPPTRIWIRGLPTYGFMYLVPMFRRVLIVATGSGIAPCTSHLLKKKIPLRLLWVAPNIQKTYGSEFVDTVLGAEPGAVVYDTREHGKPDVVKLTYRMVREFNAEAVFIVSNPKLTQKVVYGLMSRGIPTFGAIWDS